MNLSEKSIQRLKPGPRREQYLDDSVTGFGVRIEPNGRKSFYWFVKAAGKPLFRALGEVGSVSLKEARDEASELAGKLSAWRKAKYQGPNPFEKKKIIPPTASPSFKQLLEAYLERHVRLTANNPEHAEYSLRSRLKNVADWFDRPLDGISKRDVLTVKNKMLEAYKEKTKKAPHGGKYQLNRMLEDIRALFNWSAGKDEGDEVNFWPVKENPAVGVAIKKNKKNDRDTFLKPRERFLQPEELVRLYAELKKETSKDLRDFITLALATGARKDNIVSAKWEDIKFERNVWELPLTKTKPYDIELTPAAREVFDRRYRQRAEGEVFVFPARSKSGHREDMKKEWQRFRVRAKFPDVRIHDIRRTAGSYQAIAGVSLQTIGASLGHANGSSATQIYARLHQSAVTEARKRGEEKMKELMLAAKRRAKLTEKRAKLLTA